MKWIKASERMPMSDFELFCVKTDGGGCDHYQTGDSATIEYELNAYNPNLHAFEPEWLDETEQPSHISGQGREAELEAFIKKVSEFHPDGNPIILIREAKSLLNPDKKPQLPPGKEVNIETLYRYGQWLGQSKSTIDNWLNNIDPQPTD